MAAVLLVSAGLALWLDLSPIHAHHNGDSFVPVLSSLYQWTPFFWEQNRFGMLLPLLAIPIQHPFHNLLFQVGVRLFAVLLSFFLLARVVVPRPYWPAVGAAAFALFLAGKDLQAHAFFQMQPYGQTIALCLAGLLALESRRPAGMAAGVALLALGFWISPTALIWLAPLIVLRAFLGVAEPALRHTLGLLALLGLLFGLSLFVSWLSVYRNTDFGSADPEVWPAAWRTLGLRAVEYLTPELALAAAAALAAVVAGAFLLPPAPRAVSRRAAAAGVCLLLLALTDLLVMGTTSWAQVNGWKIRYVATALLTGAMILPAVLLTLLLEGRSRPWHRAANLLALAALPAIALFAVGPPSMERARAALDAHGRATADLLATRSTHLLGDFFKVWPAVFHANLARYESGEAGTLWGIAHRSAPTKPLWKPRRWSAARIAVIAGDEFDAERSRRRYGVPPLCKAEERGRVHVYTTESRNGSCYKLRAP